MSYQHGFFIGDIDSIALNGVAYQVLSCVRDEKYEFQASMYHNRRIKIESLLSREQVSMTKPKVSWPSLLHIMFRANPFLLHQDGSRAT